MSRPSNRLIYYGDAGVTSSDAHATRQHGPGVGLGVVNLHRREIAAAVVASHDVQKPVQGHHSGVAPAESHVADRRPHSLRRIVRLDGFAHLGSVVAAHRVQDALEHAHPGPATSATHVRHGRPTVDLGGVALHGAQALTGGTVITANLKKLKIPTTTIRHVKNLVPAIACTARQVFYHYSLSYIIFVYFYWWKIDR
jgi:hypothetical protein